MEGEVAGRALGAAGVYAVGGVLYLVEAVTVGDGFEIRHACRRECRKGGELTAERLAEEIGMLCRTHGITRRVGVVCPRDECYLFERVYPPLERKELDQAVQWDITVNCPFTGQRYWTGFSFREGRVLAAVLDEARGWDRWQALRKARLEVAEMFLAPEGLTAQLTPETVCLGDTVFHRNTRVRETDWTEEMTLALYGAWNVLQPGREDVVGFLPQDCRPETRPWLSYAVWLAAAVAFLMAEVFLINCWKLREAERRFEEVRQRYDWLEDDRRQAAEFKSLRAENEATDEALIRLSAGRRSWYYAFYVLGLLQVDGVWLTQFEPAEDGSLRCRGEAPSYGALMEYVGLFEDNASLLSAPPVLEHFEQAEPGTLSFTLKLRF